MAPYSGLLVFGQLWLGAIYNFLKRWTVVTDPNGTGMFLCYGFLVQGNTDQTTDNGYTLEEKHKPPEQVIIMIITTR